MGESLAADWLKRQGFKILDRNYLTKFGEIDIVGKKDGKIVFFEVKTVTQETSGGGFPWQNEDHYEPEDNIHPWKLKRLSRTIEIYLSDKNIDEDSDWQLDCLSVYLDGEGRLIKIEQVEDVF